MLDGSVAHEQANIKVKNENGNFLMFFLYIEMQRCFDISPVSFSVRQFAPGGNIIIYIEYLWSPEDQFY